MVVSCEPKKKVHNCCSMLVAFTNNHYSELCQDTWSCVSGQERCVTHELFTGTIKLSNLASHISKTTELIFTKVTYFIPYIYMT